MDGEGRQTARQAGGSNPTSGSVGNPNLTHLSSECVSSPHLFYIVCINDTCYAQPFTPVLRAPYSLHLSSLPPHLSCPASTCVSLLHTCSLPPHLPCPTSTRVPYPHTCHPQPPHVFPVSTLAKLRQSLTGVPSVSLSPTPAKGTYMPSSTKT
ncbi:hypothetical protein Pmani_035297 [Petrolisthes manimaculis]|uniref:Uncharacterized protein n=1 Tax=Petrolisthes manimaculis TaxID=1843537 RepID=A0AAE1NM15_9EUCA|nr:hypothetical protein Pmani_035297 [Petrolisthes manimaculis]